MPLHFRRAFFYLYVGLFLLLAPLVVLFTAGYRWNWQTGRVAQLGALSISSNVKGATVLLDGKALSGHTPIIARRTLPGTYQLSIQKDGYTVWQRQIDVRSRQTTEVHKAILFLQPTPEQIVPLSTHISTATSNGSHLAYGVIQDPWFEIWIKETATDRLTLLDRLNSTSIHNPTLRFTHDDYLLILEDTREGKPEQHFYTTSQALSDVPAWFTTYRFVSDQTATNIINDNTADKHVVARLPLGTYQIKDVFDHLLLIADLQREQLLLIDTTTSGPPILFSLNAQVYRFSDGWLYVSDGFELRRYQMQTNLDQLITRTGTPIQDVMAYPGSDTIITVTATQVIASDISDLARTVNTTLFSADTIQSFWINGRGSVGYALATINNQQGLYQIALTK